MNVSLRKTLAFGMLLQLAFPVGAHAEWVRHHSLRVESEAGYAECLACHDGVLASSVSPCLAAVCLFKGPHPIARPYPPPAKAEQFAPPGEAQRSGIRFVNGRIDCISCHDLHNGGQYHLRVPAAESRLCFACHRK